MKSSHIVIGFFIFNVILLLPGLILAAAGGLDPTFDGDGKVTTDFGTSGDYAQAIVLQPDGKIIAAGSMTLSGNCDYFALARYNSDGSLDTTFGVNGKVTTDITIGIYDCAEAVVLQPDGKIIVAGVSNQNFALARYNPDGILDFTFDLDGIVTTDFGSSGDAINDIVLQPDGKIIAVGVSNNDFALARYNPDGSLDTNFDGDGKLTTDFGSVGDSARAVALQQDGKIVVAGVGSGLPLYDYVFALARYNADGSLDTTFDFDGKVTTHFASTSDHAVDVVLQPNGKIITIGITGTSGTSNDFALARYNIDGSLDSTFDGDGKVITDFASAQDLATAVTLQSDGKIIVSGSTVSSSNDYDFAVARYNLDGSLDTGFNGDGKVTTDFGGLGDDAGSDVILQADGKIIVAGNAATGANNYDFALARYQGDVCIFCDDFEDGVLASNWTYAKPQWSEAGGNLIGTPIARKAETIALPAFSGCNTCSVSTNMSSSGGLGNKVWLLLWFMDSKNTIEVLMKEENDKWVLKQRVGGSVVAKTKGIAQIDPNVFHNVIVSFDGSNFRLAVNGVLLCTMPAFTSPYGTVGFRVKNTTGSFGFIAVN